MTFIDVDKTVRALNRMTIAQLRERYGEIFGEAARALLGQYLSPLITNCSSAVLGSV